LKGQQLGIAITNFKFREGERETGSILLEATLYLFAKAIR